MAEWAVTAIFICICLGQAWAVHSGMLRGATYYVCVAPLGYFSVWYWATWSPDRACAAILVAAWLIKGRRERLKQPVHFFQVYAYWGVLITLICGIIWPSMAATLPSSAYRDFRIWIQVANWVALTGAGWIVGKSFAYPGAFARARPVILTVGTILSGYAVYQAFALPVGLPATGIRRPVVSVSAEAGGEQFASYTFAGRRVYRPGSLIGEPKGLGAGCVFWLALTVTCMPFRSAGRLRAAQIGLFVFALWFTASTSAWAGCLALLLLGLLAFRKVRQSRALWVVAVTFPALIVISQTASKDSFLSRQIEQAKTRSTDRLIHEGPVGDLAERIALDILNSNPILYVFGTGFGGISSYIADKLTTPGQLILFPNNGLLGMICNFGVAGLLMLLLSLSRGLAIVLRAKDCDTDEARALGFVGVVCLTQCLIFGQTWLLSWSFGFLLAAEFRNMHRPQFIRSYWSFSTRPRSKVAGILCKGVP